MIQIALFGTSADPPTAGHQAIVKWLSNRYDLVAVWASDNPFKVHQSNLAQRTEMLKLSIEEIDSPKHNIHVCEELSDRRSLVTVDRAREIWGDFAEFTLVIGADLVPQIPRWYRSDELLQKVKLLIIPRPGYLIEDADLEILRNLSKQKNEERIAIAPLQGLAVSSTEYRRGDRQTITPAIENYIRQKRLYPRKDRVRVSR
jgi:nicotinate-nucleotide adenylyltransferase